jgi:ketosteroid isomerase-like protein
MSKENLDTVRRWVELWNAGDLAAFEALHAPDVETVPPDGWPDGEVSRDRDAWMKQVIRIKDSWESDRIEPEELHEAGNSVIMRDRWTTTGKGSGIIFENLFWVVFTFASGTITRLEFFMDRSRALEAAGIAGQGAGS